MGLLQTLTPGSDVGKKQQAALAFVQAQKQGTTAEAVAVAQRRSVLQSLVQALRLAGLPEQPTLQTLLPPPRRAHVHTGAPVTLTAISGRLPHLPAVLESLRQQTYRPARVHLHLSQEPHLLDRGVAANDPFLQKITADGWV